VNVLKIEDLTLENAHEAIGLCIAPKAPFEKARREKLRWLKERLPDPAGGKLAYSDESLAGMLEYSLVEDAPFPVNGKDLLHINCIWVLPEFQRRGIGKSLMRASLIEAKARRRKGLSVISYDGTFLMPTTFFLHEGFRRIQIRGREELMWREIEPCTPPTFLPHRYLPRTSAKKIMVDVLCSPQCPWSVITRQRLEKVSREFGREVKISSVTTNDREAVEQLGDSRKVFVNGTESFLFPPTEDDIRKTIELNRKELAKTALLRQRAS
jgi:GNAT superfamily N-acetyltransferase